jgi:peptidoglycan-associated lipoprotein
MTTSTLCVMAIAVTWGQMLAGWNPAVAGAREPDTAAIVAQASLGPSARAPGDPNAAADRRVGLPRLRDYEPVPELRDIHFGFGQAAIRPADVKILDANAAWLHAHPGHLVLIEGHSDNRGTTTSKNEFNMALAERRAQAAMSHLVTRGVEPSRITILSYGEERPECTEDSARCRSQNRRARFLVKPR